ncbi:Asp23/Gls24 family envelope stress response protein [Mucilaginibacter lappiensis]|uniref:Uncharacterized protein n=1 Tax=Mucilaginibacter lappiensis TaxID=354630 RepID=A0A841J7P6_9SPHI|nr:hypothetical protein [Mucilaginibacter lappiensis]MBB6126382.1 hypothetical protein [Mucilaginibacter lappiensis]
MKTSTRIIRAVLFTIIAFISVNIIFWGFNIFIDWLLLGLGYLQTKLSGIFFWGLFFLIGIAIISILWGVFKYLAVLLLALFARLAPSKDYAGWTIMIISFLNACFCIYGFWHNNGWPNLVTGLTGIVICGMALSLVGILTDTIYKFLKSYEVGALEHDSFERNEGMYYNMEILDNVSVDGVLTDKQVDAMRDIYKSPEMTREEAQDKFNEIKGYK